MSGARSSAGPSKQRSRPPAKRPAGRSAKRRPPRPLGRRILLWIATVGGLGLLSGIALFLIGYALTDIPDPNEDFQTQTTYVYYAKGKQPIGKFANQDRESIPLDEVPEHVQDAVIAAENRSFWTDRGIDPKGIIRAAFSNAQGNATQGASTITQQYVKVLYLSQERSYTRKVKEAFLSLKIQRQLSKREILEGYLNTIYFGRGAYGIEAAAKAYFDKPAKDLSVAEGAVLASVLNSPSGLDPANGPEARADLFERYDYVLRGMVDEGMIDPNTGNKARAQLPKFPKVRNEDAYGGQRGFMLKLVRQALVSQGFSEDEIDGGGLRVRTTFTRKAMEAARAGVLEQRPDGFGKQLHVGVASVEPGTGALRGFFAGQDFLQSQINWAMAGGQPGSSFKPFALAAGIKDGYSLRDTFEGNSPLVLENGEEIKNYGEGTGTNFGSAINLIKATEDSVNTAYVDLTMSMDNGPEKVIRMARALGIPKSVRLDPFPAVALGSAVVPVVDMANAFATIANGGRRADWYVVQSVTNSDGDRLWRHRVKTTRVLDEDIAADVSYAMQQVVRSGSGTKALALGRPAAGKTGTATNAKDEVSSSWFVGYTPQMSTAVMYARGDGNDQLDGWLPEYYGGTYPALTWTSVMQRLMEGLPVEDFPEPAFVDGEAPESGHAPVPTATTTRPSPTRTPSPTTPTEEPTQEPTTPPPPTTNPPGSPSPSESPPPLEPTPPGDGDGGGREPSPSPSP